MGYAKSNTEKEYLEAHLGNRWVRVLSNGQIFNWFADYAAQESKIDREKIVKRLRVFSSRSEAPTAFWVVLISKFYEEGGHLGLRRYEQDGVTFYCPPQFFDDFRSVCRSAPAYRTTVSWVFQPNWLNGWIYAQVLTAGNRNWFKKSWPDALKMRGRRYLVSYYPTGTVNLLSDGGEEEDNESLIEAYRNTHSLLCLAFRTQSPAAYDICLGESAAKEIREVLQDPYLAASSTGFNQVALDLAAMCAAKDQFSDGSAVKGQILQLLKHVAKTHHHLAATIVADADYMYSATFPLMPLAKKGGYGAVMADFEAAMKTIVIEHTDEINEAAKRLKGEDEVKLWCNRSDPKNTGKFTLRAVRQYLANNQANDYMPLQAFDALIDMAAKPTGKRGGVVQVQPLKEIVRQRVGRLTQSIESEGEFLVTQPLLVGLMAIGKVRREIFSGSYGDLLFQRDSKGPWVRTKVKFEGRLDHLDDTWNEFIAFCRIIGVA